LLAATPLYFAKAKVSDTSIMTKIASIYKTDYVQALDQHSQTNLNSSWVNDKGTESSSSSGSLFPAQPRLRQTLPKSENQRPTVATNKHHKQRSVSIALAGKGRAPRADIDVGRGRAD